VTTLTARQIARVAYTAGFRGDGLVTAVAVALAESSGRVEVVNSIGCVGLWQINQPVHVAAHPKWTRAWLQVASHNAEAAFTLSARGTRWNPWSAYTSGAYKKFLATAREASTNLATSPSNPNPGGADWGPGADGKDKDNPDKPEPPDTVEDPNPRVRLGRVFVHGNKLDAEIAEVVTDASLSWSTTEVTQLSLTVNDPGFVLWRKGIFAKGVALLYREPGMKDVELRISATSLDGGAGGLGGFTVLARSKGVQALRRRRGPKVMKKASPTDFVKAECKAVGLEVVAQSTATRGQVARDVPAKGDEDSQGADKPSSWTTFLRLAEEVGFVCFEFMGTVYFGKPTWLIEQDKEPVQVALPLPGSEEAWMSRTMPTIDDSEDASAPVSVSGIELEPGRLGEVRPGGALRLRGLPPFNDKYLITSVTLPLLGTAGIDVSAETPINPEPQPPEPSGGSSGRYDDGKAGSESAASAVQAGSKSALDFVRIAISASSASYVFGAEALSSDPSPSALDCSELVQWALGRMGIAFTDGSANQIAAARKITVATALKTRGALLYKVGHIGISMGDGRSVEARNPSDGVGIFRAADIAWTAGGLVPGLRYA
jgi:cell wall-associated NlpC family hydrolase